MDSVRNADLRVLTVKPPYPAVLECVLDQTMNEEQTKIEIAKLICKRFMNMNETTPRHTILIMCESPDLLSQMEQRCLLRDTDRHDNYLPTSGSFALLGDEDELFKFARMAFERTAHALWTLYYVEGPGVDHEPFEFTMYVNRLHDDQIGRA